MTQSTCPPQQPPLALTWPRADAPHTRQQTLLESCTCLYCNIWVQLDDMEVKPPKHLANLSYPLKVQQHNKVSALTLDCCSTHIACTWSPIAVHLTTVRHFLTIQQAVLLKGVDKMLRIPHFGQIMFVSVAMNFALIPPTEHFSKV